MDSLAIEAVSTISLTTVQRKQDPFAAANAPQAMTSTRQYSSANTATSEKVTEAMCLAMVANPSSTATSDISSAGTTVNPVFETTSLSKLQEIFVFYPDKNADGTATPATVTVDFDADIASAMGFSVGFTLTMNQLESFTRAIQQGNTVPATAVITLHNPSGAAKATLLIVVGGKK